MKNILVVDGAINCVYDIFSAPNDDFDFIFPNGTDIAFIDEVLQRVSDKEADRIFGNLWSQRIRKIDVHGIHGILFYELENKKEFYPTRKDEEATDSEGGRIR